MAESEKVFEVTIPADAVPGQQLTQDAPDGTALAFVVPNPIPASRKINIAYEPRKARRADRRERKPFGNSSLEVGICACY